MLILIENIFIICFFSSFLQVSNALFGFLLDLEIKDTGMSQIVIPASAFPENEPFSTSLSTFESFSIDSNLEINLDNARNNFCYLNNQSNEISVKM